MEQTTEAPKIEFPCDYPIKVMGRSSDVFESVILEVFERHAPGFRASGSTTSGTRRRRSC